MAEQENKAQETSTTPETKVTGEVTRREFLKDAGMVLGGAALAATALGASACGGDGTTTPAGTTGGTTGGPTSTGSLKPADFATEQVVQIKATHQWAVNDTRDRMLRAFGQMCFERSGGTIYFFYFPNQALFKARDTWDALRTGACECAVLPLDYASGKEPLLSITLLPCLVQGIKEGLEWRTKPIGKAVDELLLSYNVRHVLWAWTDGSPGAKKHMIKLPADCKGDKIRAAGRMVEYMFQQAGAQINSMPSAEIYSALVTGVLDSAVTSSASFVTFHLEEQLNFINVPRDYCMWYMEEGMLMSEKRFNILSPKQKQVFLECAAEVQNNWVYDNFSKDTTDMIREFSARPKMELYYMNKQEYDVWELYSRETAWKKYIESDPRAQGLLDKGLDARLNKT
jgi:TRAP-type C4-dicarboxylate transport system substrate-binding protein